MDAAGGLVEAGRIEGLVVPRIKANGSRQGAGAQGFLKNFPYHTLHAVIENAGTVDRKVKVTRANQPLKLEKPDSTEVRLNHEVRGHVGMIVVSIAVLAPVKQA